MSCVFNAFSSCQKLFSSCRSVVFEAKKNGSAKAAEELQEKRSKFTVYLNGDAWP